MTVLIILIQAFGRLKKGGVSMNLELIRVTACNVEDQDCSPKLCKPDCNPECGPGCRPTDCDP